MPRWEIERRRRPRPFSPDFMAACDGQLKTQLRWRQILAERFKISREDMDEFARSNRIDGPRRTSTRVRCRQNWCPFHQGRGRPGDRPAARSRRGHPARRHDGVARGACRPRRRGTRRSPPTSRGNASQMSDGSAAMLIADRATAEKWGSRCARCSVTWWWRATTPCSCCRAESRDAQAARSLGMTIDDFDAIECNEAFAAIA